jgi:hypothetical protein
MSIDRLTGAARDIGQVPVWLLVVAVAAGVLAAGAATVVAPRHRAEAIGHLAVGVTAAGAALPDTELIVVGAIVLALAAGVVAVAPTVPDRWWPVLAVLAGLVVAWVLFDGARGRPGTVLLVPVLVAPALALARWPGRVEPLAVVARLAAGLVVGVAAGRLTGLGDGTLRPALGGVAGAVVVAAGLRAIAARR